MTLAVAIQLASKIVLTTIFELWICFYQLDRYRDIHSRGVIHNGVKPANICIPVASSKSQGPQSNYLLHIIDFGLSYDLDVSGQNILPKRIEIVGNRRFLSLFAHHGIGAVHPLCSVAYCGSHRITGQSQRDDLESIAYLLSFLHHGYLPWDKPYASTSSGDSHPHIWRRKMATPASILFAGMDPAYVAFFKDVKGLAFGEMPNYEEMKARFSACWRNRGFDGQPGEVDWNNVLQLNEVQWIWETGKRPLDMQSVSWAITVIINDMYCRR